MCCAVEKVSLTRTWRRMFWEPLAAQQPGRRSRNHPHPSTSKGSCRIRMFFFRKTLIPICLKKYRVQFSCIFLYKQYSARYPDLAFLLPDYPTRKAYPATTMNEWRICPYCRNEAVDYALPDFDRAIGARPDIRIVMPDYPVIRPTTSFF